MSTVHAADNLYAWTITLDGGEERVALGSSLQTVIGNAPNIISAVRGPAFTTDVPPPVVDSIVPTTAALGAPDFTLSVHGTEFRDGYVILWNGSPEPTTFVSDMELTTLVNMATATTAAEIPVAVRSLAGRDSNVVPFTLTETARAGEKEARRVDADQDVPVRGGAPSPKTYR